MAQTRKKRTRSSKKSKGINRLGVFTVALLAVFALGLVYLSKHEKITVAKKETTQSTTKVAKKSKTKPRFEFYNVLPKTNLTFEKPNDKPAKLDRGYLLQVASVKNYEDADRLKAKLILMGYDVDITQVKAKSGTYNRINVGPYRSERAAQLAKARLAELHYQAVLRKFN